MASCIHPSCGCKAYEDSKHPKGTLLQFCMGCRTCGHQTSEHRQLTAVDTMIEKELAAASQTRCTHCIPISEIPCSPIFGPHDPIPLLFENAPEDKESGVPCTCLGFQVTSLVRLWQKFRTYSMRDTLEALPQVACTFCQHQLQEHQKIDNSRRNTAGLGNTFACPDFKMKSSARVSFLPINGQCVQIIPPKDPNADVVLVGLSNSEEPTIHICRSRSRMDEQDSEVLIVSVESHSISGGNGKDNCVSDAVSERVSQSVVSASSGVQVSSETERLSGNSKKGRKRKQRLQSAGSRKSARITAKQLEIEEAPQKGKELVVSLQLKDLNVGGGGISHGNTALMETMATFVESLKSSEKFMKYKLPEDVSSSNILLMKATICCKDPVTRRSTLLLALSGAGGRMFVCAPEADMHWVAVSSEPSSPSAIRSLCWKELSEAECASATTLCTGTSDGNIHIWSVQLDVGSNRIQCSLAGHHQNTHVEITTLSWSSKGRFLAAGTLSGEVLIFSCVVGGSALQHLQTNHCCGAPVTCFAWSPDSNTLAVGGSDDCVQLLHYSPGTDTSRIPRTSILNYMKVESEKFTHTHCYRGHQSFVADLQFINNTLISVGWDGQILFWQGEAQLEHSAFKRRKEHLPYIDTEPQDGFKMGPSASVEFIPLAMHMVLDCGVLILVVDRHGAITVVNYSNL